MREWRAPLPPRGVSRPGLALGAPGNRPLTRHCPFSHSVGGRHSSQSAPAPHALTRASEQHLPPPSHSRLGRLACTDHSPLALRPDATLFGRIHSSHRGSPGGPLGAGALAPGAPCAALFAAAVAGSGGRRPPLAPSPEAPTLPRSGGEGELGAGGPLPATSGTTISTPLGLPPRGTRGDTSTPCVLRTASAYMLGH